MAEHVAARQPAAHATRRLSDSPLGGELNAAIARRVVKVYRDVAGRGPTRAQAFFHHDIVVVVLRGVMTRAELSVMEAGDPEAVATLRQELHATMRPLLIAAVEELTGGTVAALMSDADREPDTASHVFVLDRPLDTDEIPGVSDDVAEGARARAGRAKRRTQEMKDRSASLAASTEQRISRARRPRPPAPGPQSRRPLPDDSGSAT
jgi:uncharacterized protein YbcI